MADLRSATAADLEAVLGLHRSFFAEGIRALHLEVERYKEDAQALYRRAGFADHDRYLMTKWIE